jgi:uncharacterized protein YkwD
MKQTIWLTALFLGLGLHAGSFSSLKAKPVVQSVPVMNIAYEKSEALGLLNDVRESMGMNTLIHNDQLALAAQAHANYLIRNHVTSHREIPGFPAFTGKTPADRAIRAGYLSRQVMENLSTQNRDAKSSIDGLFSAIYHRFGFLDVSIDEVGVGVTQDPQEREKSAFVYLMGNTHLNALCYEPAFKGYGKYVYKVCKDEAHRIAQKRFFTAQNVNKKYNPKIVFYPYDGQQDVPPVFYEEIPDPLPDYDVSGFPVSVTFNDYYFKKVNLVSFRLYKGENVLIPPVRVLSSKSDPNARFTAHQFALFPLKRLEYDTDYRAEVIYRVNGKKRSKSWQFHTRKLLEPMFRIAQKKATIRIRKGQSYFLYLVPMNPHDVVKKVTFPEKVNVTFYDNNTLRINLLPGAPRDFEIESRGRKIHVIVE